MSAYSRPASLAEVLAQLAQANENTRIIAGATDVFPARATARAWGQYTSENWLDISGLSELRQIQTPRQSGSGCWKLGALVTWSDILQAELPAAFAGLVAAAQEVGGVQIQNRATLVGNLCNASPAADGVPALLCLDATVEATSRTATRSLPLSKFILGNRHTALRSDELVTALHIPPPAPQARGYFQKLGARSYLVISIVSVAAVVTVGPADIIEDIRIAVGACSVVALRLTALEEQLRGCKVTASLTDKVQPAFFSSLLPVDDVRADAGYRQAAATELVIQVLQQLQVDVSGAAR